MDVYNVESLPYNSLIVWTKKSHNCCYTHQLVVVFAFTNFCFLKTCCFNPWLHVVIVGITLIGTLLGIGLFVATIKIIFGLVRNIFWTFAFLGQLGARCSKQEQIIQGYLNGTIASLTGYVVTSTTGLATLVGTTGTIDYSLFLLWQVSFA